MKKIFITAVLFIGLTACTKDKNDVNTGTLTPLTQQEKADLQFLREEEKLAHDVYIYAYRKYQVQIFSNIANSELTHTNTVLGLLNNYAVPDPAAGKAEGVFTDTTLQKLYVELTAICDSLVTRAYFAGATIEDLDIFDIVRLQSHTTNTNILNVYSKLTCGSRNHMRAFTTQLGS